MDLLTLMSGVAGRGWVEGALLLGLFWAALAHPERIRRPWEFRLAALCLGLSLVTQPVLQFLLAWQRVQPGRRLPTGAVADGEEWLFLTALVGPPVLTLLAILFGIDSIMPRRAQPVSPGRVEPGL